VGKSGSDSKRSKTINHAARAKVAREQGALAVAAAVKMEGHRRMLLRVIAVLLARMNRTPESAPVVISFADLAEGHELGLRVLGERTPTARVAIGLVPRDVALTDEEYDEKHVEQVGELAAATDLVDEIAERPRRSWLRRAWDSLVLRVRLLLGG